jgi:hypothetical protein
MAIVGDKIYGDFALNRSIAAACGDKKLQLISQGITLRYALGNREFHFSATASLEISGTKLMRTAKFWAENFDEKLDDPTFPDSGFQARD